MKATKGQPSKEERIRDLITLAEVYLLDGAPATAAERLREAAKMCEELHAAFMSALALADLSAGRSDKSGAPKSPGEERRRLSKQRKAQRGEATKRRSAISARS